MLESNVPTDNSTHVQFRLDSEIMNELAQTNTGGMSLNQYVKMMFLKTVDPAASSLMQQRAAEGRHRLT